MTIHYKSDAEIEAVVRGLESCSTGKDEFPHYKHLVVAVWYLRDLAPAEAFTKMRENLLRFLAHHDLDRNIYKDELTRAWIDLVDEELKLLDANTPIFSRINIIMDRLKDKDAVFKRYPDNLALQRDREDRK